MDANNSEVSSKSGLKRTFKEISGNEGQSKENYSSLHVLPHKMTYDEFLHQAIDNEYQHRIFRRLPLPPMTAENKDPLPVGDKADGPSRVLWNFNYGVSTDIGSSRGPLNNESVVNNQLFGRDEPNQASNRQNTIYIDDSDNLSDNQSVIDLTSTSSSSISLGPSASVNFNRAALLDDAATNKKVLSEAEQHLIFLGSTSLDDRIRFFIASCRYNEIVKARKLASALKLDNTPGTAVDEEMNSRIPEFQITGARKRKMKAPNFSLRTPPLMRNFWNWDHVQDPVEFPTNEALIPRGLQNNVHTFL